MDSKDLNNAVFDYLNLSYAKPTKDATQETVSPIMVTPSGDLKVGQEYLAMLSLTVEGENLYELNVPNTGKSKAYGSTIELPENIQSKCSNVVPGWTWFAFRSHCKCCDRDNRYRYYANGY